MAVRAVLYCCAVLCCTAAAVRAACVCFHRGHQKRCFFARKCSRILRTNNKICTWWKTCRSAYFGKRHASKYITLVVTSGVGNNLSNNHVYCIIPTRSKTACKPWAQYATDVKNLLFLARLEFSCKTGRVARCFQYKNVAFWFSPKNLSLKLLNITPEFHSYHTVMLLSGLDFAALNDECTSKYILVEVTSKPS